MKNNSILYISNTHFLSLSLSDSKSRNSLFRGAANSVKNVCTIHSIFDPSASTTQRIKGTSIVWCLCKTPSLVLSLPHTHKCISASSNKTVGLIFFPIKARVKWTKWMWEGGTGQNNFKLKSVWYRPITLNCCHCELPEWKASSRTDSNEACSEPIEAQKYT